MLLRIDHETKLTYTEPVTESAILLRMAPPSDDGQTLLHYRLRTEPAAPVTAYRDGFGNRVDMFNVLPPHRAVGTVASSFVRTHRRSGPDRLAGIDWPVDALPELDALEFLQSSTLVDGGGEV